MKDYSETSIRKDYENLTKLLIKKNLYITTMESATSGQIASLITDTEGSSAIFKGADITYSNDTKIMRGVSKDIIEKYSVYSEETAREMAKTCAKTYSADIGIGVTGTMGNTDPNNLHDSVPGQVYFAICFKGNVSSYHIELEPRNSRLEYKMAVAKEIYDKLIKIIEESE